jgi:hypothetical protein
MTRRGSVEAINCRETIISLGTLVYSNHMHNILNVHNVILIGIKLELHPVSSTSDAPSAPVSDPPLVKTT